MNTRKIKKQFSRISWRIKKKIEKIKQKLNRPEIAKVTNAISGGVDTVYKKIEPAGKIISDAAGTSLINCAFIRLGIILILSEFLSFAYGKQMYTRPADMLGFGLLLCAVAGLLSLMTDSMFLGCAIGFIISCILALINYYKLRITGIAFSFPDFSLWKKFGSIVKLNSESIHVTKVSFFMVLVTITVLAICLYADRKLPKWHLSEIVKLEYFAVFFCVFCYMQPFNAKTGSLLSLWTSAFSKTKSYEISFNIEDLIAEGKENQPEYDYPETQPNVIVILSESFFDVTKLDGVSYDDDPIKYYHEILNESVSGKFYTRSVGYGTSAIEMEVLTGLSTVYLGQDQYLSEWSEEKLDKLDSIPKLYKNAGYETYYIHSFNDTVYNRSASYPYLGFDNMLFSNSLGKILPEYKKLVEETKLTDATEIKNQYYNWLASRYLIKDYYSDELIADSLISICEENEKPVFIFAASVENHTPFKGDKYENYDYTFTADLNEEETGVLNAVTQGVADESKMLEKLTEYLRASDEPTVVLYFGDHRPNMLLENDSTVYESLGIAGPISYEWDLDQSEIMYGTDYLIWSNDDAYMLEGRGVNKDSSTNFFGLDILKYGNIELPESWQLLTTMQKHFKAWTWFYVEDNNGNIYYSPSESDSRELKQYTNYLSYYFQRAIRN